VLELELLDREKRSAERRFKGRTVPTIQDADTFDFAARPSVNKMLIGEWCDVSTSTTRERFVIGNPGQAKVIWRQR